jgi:putative heme-binding domain-containing protein
MVRDNRDRDPFLRHAAVIALWKINDGSAMRRYRDDPDRSVRLVLLLVQRRFSDPKIVGFLTDPDWALVLEAARAINDIPIEQATTALADALPHLTGAAEPWKDPLLRRGINAAFRLGRSVDGGAIAAIAANANLSQAIRLEALSALSNWTDPSQRDRVTGVWRPLAPRDAVVASEAVRTVCAPIIDNAEAEVAAAMIEVVAQLHVAVDGATVANWVTNRHIAADARATALRYLFEFDGESASDLVPKMLEEDAPQLRAEARELWAKNDPSSAVQAIEEILQDESAAIFERQHGLATLARMEKQAADQVLRQWGMRLIDGRVPEALRLDLWEALAQRKDALDVAAVWVACQAWQERANLEAKIALISAGGEVYLGEEVFASHPAAQCIRCHTVSTRGGTAGPDLTKVGGRENRKFLAESLLNPNAKIATGYRTVTLILKDGRIVRGTVVDDGPEQVRLKTSESEVMTIDAEQIDERLEVESPMPNAADNLSLRQLRDLVAYLESLK